MSHTEHEPILLGDSIFHRLFVEYPDLFRQLSADLTVGGQRIHDLKVLVKEHREKIKDSYVVLMIGTNDVLKGTPLTVMKAQFKSVLRLLRRLKVNVLVAELLPIARYSLESDKNKTVKTFNAYIRSCCSGNNGVSSLSLFDDFLVGGCVDQSLYCSFMGGPNSKRVDRIHPNHTGLRRIFEKIIGYITSLEV